MPEEVLFNQESATEGSDKDGHAIGAGRVLVIASQTAMLYRDSTYVKSVDLADKPARQMFIIDLIEEEGAMKSRVAQALKISRQTIDNYLDIKKHFGTEGFVRGYSVSQTKSKRKQREIHAKERPSGNKAELVAELRKKERERSERGRSGTWIFRLKALGSRGG